MTTEGASATFDATATVDDDALHCYRHPDRETRISCGRCERPICTRCAMQGPVGFRCRVCGTLANDPLRTISPVQGLIAFAIALGLGLVLGLISSRFSFFTIFVAFIAGGFVAEGVTRLIGYKRGPAIMAIIFGGITAGSLAGFTLDYFLYWSDVIRIASEIAEQFGVPSSLFFDNLMWGVISAGAACVGAYSRLR